MIRPTTQVRVGLAVWLVGLLLFAIGFGTGLDYLYNQSHPVPPAVAFSLKLEYTVAGFALGAVGFGLALRGFFSTSAR